MKAQGGKGTILIWTVPAPQGKWEEQREGDCSSHSPFILQWADGELTDILSIFLLLQSQEKVMKRPFSLWPTRRMLRAFCFALWNPWSSVERTSAGFEGSGRVKRPGSHSRKRRLLSSTVCRSAVPVAIGRANRGSRFVVGKGNGGQMGHLGWPRWSPGHIGQDGWGKGIDIRLLTNSPQWKLKAIFNLILKNQAKQSIFLIPSVVEQFIWLVILLAPH